MPKEEAERRVKSLEFDIDDAARGFNEGKAVNAKELVQQSAVDFLRLTNKDSSLERFTYTERRAYADFFKKEVNVGELVTKQTTFHEMAHFLEREDFLRLKAAQEWRDARATGKAKPLRYLTDENYDEDEIALPDKFIHPYVGKVYSHASTEVISVGLEHFSDAKNMVKLYSKSREHFKLMLKILHNDPNHL